MRSQGGSKAGGMVNLFLVHILLNNSFKKDLECLVCPRHYPAFWKDNQEENKQILCFCEVHVLMERDTKQEK